MRDRDDGQLLFVANSELNHSRTYFKYMSETSHDNVV